ncbi:MAG: polysaccharide biosynthesis protein [Clostridiales bacterium]|nr:polysaccharide biosynthesis protein [Clostridiales bacterium]
MLVDVLIINLSFVFAVCLVYDFDFGDKMLIDLLKLALIRVPFVSTVFVIIFRAFGLYRSMWQYAGAYELTQCVMATIISSVACVGMDKIFAYVKFLRFSNVKPAIYITSMLLILILCCADRMLYRVVRRSVLLRGVQSGKKISRVMIVGAGNMGSIVFSELEGNGFRMGKPVVFVDDNVSKQNRRLSGVPVVGGCDRIPEFVKAYRVDTIILAFPSASSKRQADVAKIALSTGCKLKVTPSLLEFNTAKKGLQNIRNVEITDLLSRPEVRLNNKVCAYIEGSVVLVTGGGGSIGSELCRQIAKYNPSKIIIFDNYENNAFELKNNLDYIYEGKPKIEIRIGSVQDKGRLREVFQEFRPSIVFHAAAHKHVPLMEESPCEAVKNNIFGTYNTAEVAAEFKVKNFVILSTDKAVNPANVMGATKRVTELIVQYFDSITEDTKFAAVRFGNVLGSNGSVIPTFKKQIEYGGPVTVTDPNITRYFMTIPEAAQLVVQAGGLSKGGEIFVLDMGEPVKILSLAENLIKLSGMVPYVDIDIVFTGLRPGEKLYEELSMEEEQADRQMTANNKIFVTIPVLNDYDVLLKTLEELKHVNENNVRSLLKKIVPNFIESENNYDD